MSRTEAEFGALCHVVEGCLTCGDAAVAVTVVVAEAPDALCEDDHGQRGKVAVELVAPVFEGDRLLVHGGAAISRLDRDPGSP